MTAVPADPDSFRWRDIAIAVFGPTFLFGLSEGAILPILALSARELGASTALAGLLVALQGLGALLGNIPATLVAARFGERIALVSAAAFTVVALLICLYARQPWQLGVGIFCTGIASAVFMLARQTYLTEAIPIVLRARAMSTLGGTMRIGLFIGPFLGAAAMGEHDLSGSYWIGVVAIAAAGLLSARVPDLDARPRRNAAGGQPAPGMAQSLRTHTRIYLTLGTACSLVAALRACRQIVIPLWAMHINLDATTTSVVYGLMGATDMLLFYPAGKLMDARGRRWAALPSMLLMGIALLWMPFTTSLVPFVLACLLLGVGNGLGAGLIMTLGADASPSVGRTQFLGVWRFITDLGSGGGPLLLSGVTALISLGAGVGVIGMLGLLTAGMFWRWLAEPAADAPPPSRR